MKLECKDCGKHKKHSKFHLNPKFLRGYSSACKKCAIKSGKKWRKTKEGFVSSSYRGQKGSSIKRGHRLPEYTKDEFRDWLFSQKLFHELYSEWVLSKYAKRLRPSVDRKDDNIHYCFSNITLMTWGENNDKPRLANYKSVCQYTKDGEFIAEYASMKIAGAVTGVTRNNISQVCGGHRKQAGGFVWALTEKANSINSSLNIKET